MSEINTDINTKIIRVSLTNSVNETSIVNKTLSKLINDEKFIDVCLDSKALRIDCEWTLLSQSSNLYLIWVWANLTYKFDESTSRTIAVRMFNFQENPFESEDITNEFVMFIFSLFLILYCYFLSFLSTIIIDKFG